jgi:hypothetical protein
LALGQALVCFIALFGAAMIPRTITAPAHLAHARSYA